MDPELYKAATLGNVGALKKLVVADVKILYSRTPQGHTALHLALLQKITKMTRPQRRFSLTVTN